MNRRMLVIEPDATIRRMLEYALSAAGFAPTSTPTVEASRALLDGTAMDAAVLELRATNSEGTDGVRALRADYPELPLVVTGTLLTPRVMQELIRARVDDVVPKPFTPREIVSAVERVLQNSRTRHNGALEYAAAMANARRAIVEGRPRDAEAPLGAGSRRFAARRRSHGAVRGWLTELLGHDRDADRAYRAALALHDERVTEDVLPAEGLARLRAYAGARAVPTFEHHGRKTLWFVSTPRASSPLGPAGDEKPDVIVFALGLVATETGALYARMAADKQAFLIATSATSERLMLRITHSFESPGVGSPRNALAHGDQPSKPRAGQRRTGSRCDEQGDRHDQTADFGDRRRRIDSAHLTLVLGVRPTIPSHSRRSGEAGLALAKKQPPDLALVDLRLGGMDGLAVTRALAQEAPGAQVVIMTAYATIDNAVEAMRAGASDYLAKPFTPAAVKHVVARVLDSARMRQELAEVERHHAPRARQEHEPSSAGGVHAGRARRRQRSDGAPAG